MFLIISTLVNKVLTYQGTYYYVWKVCDIANQNLNLAKYDFKAMQPSKQQSWQP